MSFVGTKTVGTSEELKTLLNQVMGDNRCFFLRWPHKVSGLCRELPKDFPSPEGQVFNGDRELRWQAQGQGYSVLALSSTDDITGFEPIDSETEWVTCDRDAQVYPSTETRFPKGLAANGIDIGQRYFQDKQTATVHFVALVKR